VSLKIRVTKRKQAMLLQQEQGEIQRLTNDRLEGRVDAILKIFQNRISLPSKSGTVTHELVGKESLALHPSA